MGISSRAKIELEYFHIFPKLRNDSSRNTGDWGKVSGRAVKLILVRYLVFKWSF